MGDYSLVIAAIRAERGLPPLEPARALPLAHSDGSCDCWTFAGAIVREDGHDIGCIYSRWALPLSHDSRGYDEDP